MVWEYWSTRYLQQALDEIDEDLLDDLEEILPPLRGDSFNPTELSNRSNLVDILSAFAPSDYFKNKENMRQCLDFLPINKLRGLVSKMNELGFAISRGTHEEMRDAIVSIRC